jgi:hypothetical protein
VVEYGGAVRQAGDVTGGGGGFDVVDRISDAFSDLAARIATLPPEMLILIAAILMVGGLVFFYRRPA